MAKVYLSIGSNIARARNIAFALAKLRDRYGELKLSSIYESDPVGFEGESFYNVAVALESDDSPSELVRFFRAIEKQSGRARESPKYGPRTLDIDLLLYDELVCARSGLELPREEILRYAFVLRPLAEIAGTLRHPTAGKTIAELWSEFDDSGQATRRLQLELLQPSAVSPYRAGPSDGVPGGD